MAKEARDLVPENIRGYKLAKAIGLEVKEARFRDVYKNEVGWYHPLTKFPSALFDRCGYVYFETEDEYNRFIKRGELDGTIYQSHESDQLHIKRGIAILPEYIHFSDHLVASSPSL